MGRFMTDKEKEILSSLKSKLLKIHNDNEFVMGVVYNAGNAENWEKVINYIDFAPRTRSEILAFAIYLQDGAEVPYKSPLLTKDQWQA